MWNTPFVEMMTLKSLTVFAMNLRIPVAKQIVTFTVSVVKHHIFANYRYVCLLIYDKQIYLHINNKYITNKTNL